MRRGLLLLAVGLALVRGGVRASAGDADDAAPSPPVFSEPIGDSDGVATRLDREAAALLALPATEGSPAARPPDPAAAAGRWMDLAEGDPAACLPAPAAFRGTGAEAPPPLWPAREVAFVRLATLPEEGKRAVEARWGPRARATLEGEVPASKPALERAAREWPVTEAGGEATLLLAERDLEEGRAARAVHGLERWLRLAPVSSPARRAAVVVRLLDARALSDDDRGVAEAVERFAGLAGVPVARAGSRTTIAERGAEASAEIRARRAAKAAAEPVGPAPPRAPVLLWSRPLADPALVGEHATPDRVPAAAAASSEGALYVAEERRVSRLDPETGLVRWSFPKAPPRRDVALASRIVPRRHPLRHVVPAGRRVLTVLGDPPAGPTSTFWFPSHGRDEEMLRPQEHGRETRARLVALDAETGALLWLTGRPDERHPVLGAGDVAVASPPLVADGVVYVVLSARRGAVESWLAALDLETGEPRFVTALARGESGLDPPGRPNERPLLESHARTIPPAQAPALAGGTVCVVPGAGYAAAVDAEDGRLLWVRALPRWPLVYERPDLEDRDPGPSLREPPSPSACASLRNAPVLAAGAWVVAAPDAPSVCALDAESGALRWIGPADLHLLGAEARADGTVRVRTAGADRALATLDVRTGRTSGSLALWPERPQASGTDDLPAGRPSSDGRRVVAWRAGALRSALWGAGTAGAPAADGAVPAAGPLLEGIEGDVVRAGDVWLVTSADGLFALADPAVLERIARTPGRDAADEAMRACLLAAREASPAALRRAAEAAGRAPHPSVLEALADAARTTFSEARLSREEARGFPELLETLDTLDVLPPALRAPLHLRVGRALARTSSSLSLRGEHAALVWLLDRACTWGHEALVDVDGMGRTLVRYDLRAVHEWAGPLATTPEGVKREKTARQAVEEAGDDEAALESAARRYAGTWAAWTARVRLFGLRGEEQRFGDAARDLADLRLDRPGNAAIPLAAAASLRASEAEALRRAGERDAAREVLFDAAVAGGPWVPALGAATTGALGAAWREEDDLVPEKDPALSMLRPGENEGTVGDDRTVLSLLVPSGPGASTGQDVVLLARGGTLEAWSLTARRRSAVVAAEGAMAGLRVIDREPFVPGPGVLVTSITAGSGADRAGLLPGDWIVSWNGHGIDDSDGLLRAIASGPAGAAAPVAVLRRGASVALEVTSVDRPATERSRLEARCAWFDGAGHAVVPRRYGLAAIDLAAGTSSETFAWTGPGDVTRADVFAGTFLLHAGASVIGGGTLAAVDAATGRERWRAPVEGILPRGRAPKCVGSAVVLDLETPARTWVLDGRTGLPRASYARSDPIRMVGPGFGLPIEACAPSQGCVHLLQDTGRPDDLTLVGVNGSTGSAVSAQAVAAGARGRLYPPLLAGGGVVAVALVDREIRVFLPDLLGGTGSASPLVLDELRWNYNSVFGLLDRDSRIAVRGSTIYLLREFGRKVTLCALEIDRDRMSHSGRPDPVIWHSPRHLLPSVSSDANVRPRFLGLRATLEGAWVTAVHETTTPDASLEGRASWFDAGRDDLFAWFRAPMTFPVPPSRTLLVDGPCRVGRHVLVPVDEGFLAIPLVSRAARGR